MNARAVSGYLERLKKLDTDPVFGWRLCGLGLPGSFARAAHRCERWESRP